MLPHTARHKWQVAPVASCMKQAALLRCCSWSCASRVHFCLMPAAFLMPFSIFSGLLGHVRDAPEGQSAERQGEAAREKQANFCLSWQSLLLLPSSPPPLSLTLHRLHNYAKICCATQYFFCFPPSLLAFWTGTATGIFRLPPNPRTPPLPVLVLHVFLRSS